jgi:hypothetical protein
MRRKHDPLIGQDIGIVGTEGQCLVVGLDRLDRLITVEIIVAQFGPGIAVGGVAGHNPFERLDRLLQIHCRRGRLRRCGSLRGRPAAALADQDSHQNADNQDNDNEQHTFLFHP